MIQSSEEQGDGEKCGLWKLFLRDSLGDFLRFAALATSSGHSPERILRANRATAAMNSNSRDTNASERLLQSAIHLRLSDRLAGGNG